MAQNVEMTVKDGKLIIIVDLDKEYGLSGSGKSVIVGTTSGNVSVPGREDIKAGINIYKPAISRR
jgi:ABC-type dipeptide/oligopeptide/nickel transport system ATPase component